jgi:hypothetical protein
MATDNKGVMVYLPPDLEAVLEKYCIDNKITRKTKDGGVLPSMGTGIVQYLKSQLLGISSSNMPGVMLTRDDIQVMIDETMQLSATNEMPSDILARLEALESAMDSVKSQLPSKNLATAATKATYKVDR